MALAHHYDRVILDGPAVLGLADCRVLGRIVDASLLVVRSGSHHLMTLHRAKAMLEQSHVVIAGVVFNGLTDDMNNWSSYGYEPLPLAGGRSQGGVPANRTAGTGGERTMTGRPWRPTTLKRGSTVNLRLKSLIGDRPRAGRGRGGAGPGQRRLLRRRGLVVSPGVAAPGLRPGGHQARAALAVGPGAVLEEPALAAGTLGAGAGSLAARPVAAARWHGGSRRPRTRSIRWERLPRLAASRPAVGPARRAGPGSLAGDARPRGDLALAGGGGRLPGDLLGGHALRGSPGPALPGLGMRRGGVRAQRGLGLVQIVGQAEGLYGFLQPGGRPSGRRRRDDLLESPVDRGLAQAGRRRRPQAEAVPAFERIALVPERPFLFGTMMGGAGAFLALGSLALPLALAIVLHVISPRGSRESLSYRLKHTGAGGPGRSARGHAGREHVPGRPDGRPLVLHAVRRWGWRSVGLPRAAGSRWLVARPDLAAARVLWGLGAVLAVAWPVVVGGPPPVAPVSWEFARLVWTESLPHPARLPAGGNGAGQLRRDLPLRQDARRLVDHGHEQPAAVRSRVGRGRAGHPRPGRALVCCAACRLVSKRVGSADRTLAYGLIGAALGFSLWSVVHWTVELPAVAISASALGGTWNRWLAGGTDLFVERG